MKIPSLRACRSSPSRRRLTPLRMAGRSAAATSESGDTGGGAQVAPMMGGRQLIGGQVSDPGDSVDINDRHEGGI